MKGFAHLLLLLLVISGLIIAFLFLQNNPINKNPINKLSNRSNGVASVAVEKKQDEVQTPLIPTIDKTISQNKNDNYMNTLLGFSFEYSKNLKVTEDSEESYSERLKTQYRKNFAWYIRYEPAQVLGAIAVLNLNDSVDNHVSFEQNPFTIWVFENPSNLSIEKWYLKYWYYPFVWGDFTGRRQNVAPIHVATVSGQIVQSGTVTYQPGAPKFIYFSRNGKMYLIRIINDEVSTGDKILASFKLLNS
jgi:hypothetical protein